MQAITNCLYKVYYNTVRLSDTDSKGVVLDLFLEHVARLSCTTLTDWLCRSWREQIAQGI